MSKEYTVVILECAAIRELDPDDAPHGPDKRPASSGMEPIPELEGEVPDVINEDVWDICRAVPQRGEETDN